MATELKTVSGTWTCPPNVYEVDIECWGAGGGEYSRRTLLVTPNETYFFVVGTADYVQGGNTGNTYWVDTSTVFAQGGWDSLESGLIKISYEAVGAQFKISAIQDGVEIERRIGIGGTWTFLTEISNFDTLLYLDIDSFQDGVVYYYRMRRWENGVAGDWSNTKDVTYIIQSLNPTIFSMKSSTNNRCILKLIQEISEIEIYRRFGVLQDWLYLATVNNSNTYLDIDNFIDQEQYLYKIRKIENGLYGPWSDIKYVIYVGPVSLSMKSSVENRSILKINLKDEYIEIYRKITINGEWEYLDEVKNLTNYLDVYNFQNQSHYYYKVRLVKNAIQGSWSNIEEVIYNVTGNTVVNFVLHSQTQIYSYLDLHGSYYEIERSAGNQESWITLKQLILENTDYEDFENLEHGQIYYYRIKKRENGVITKISNIGSIDFYNISVTNIQLKSSTVINSQVFLTIFISGTGSSNNNSRFDFKKFDRILTLPEIQDLHFVSRTNNRSTINLLILEHINIKFQTFTNNRSFLNLLIHSSGLKLFSFTQNRSQLILESDQLVYNFIIKLYINNQIYSLPIFSLGNTVLYNNTVRIFYNNQVYVFDAVPTTHNAASPIRVMTNEGILALRQIY